MRISPTFREKALNLTKDIVAKICIPYEATSAEVDYENEYLPYLSEKLKVSIDRLRPASFSSKSSQAEWADDDEQRAKWLSDASWLEELTCDIQAAVHLMAEAEDEDLDTVCQSVLLALSNLRILGHFDSLSRLPLNFTYSQDPLQSDPALINAKEIQESRDRRLFVALVLEQEDWRSFRASDQNCATSATKRSVEPASAKRRQIIMSSNKSWHSNVLAPLLFVYPNVTSHIVQKVVSTQQTLVDELSNSPRKLLTRLNAPFLALNNNANSGQATSHSESDALTRYNNFAANALDKQVRRALADGYFFDASELIVDTLTLRIDVAKADSRGFKGLSESIEIAGQIPELSGLSSSPIFEAAVETYHSVAISLMPEDGLVGHAHSLVRLARELFFMKRHFECFAACNAAESIYLKFRDRQREALPGLVEIAAVRCVAAQAQRDLSTASIEWGRRIELRRECARHDIDSPNDLVELLLEQKRGIDSEGSSATAAETDDLSM